MDIALVILFLFLGICFFILEIFFLPGISVGGVAGAVFSVAGVWYAFANIGTTAGWLSVLAAAVVFAVVIWLFMRAKVLERMSLTTRLDAADTPHPDVSGLAVGDKGKAITRLAPMGMARFGDTELEVKSQDTLIDPGSEIVITEINHLTPTVTVLNHNND